MSVHIRSLIEECVSTTTPLLRWIIRPAAVLPPKTVLILDSSFNPPTSAHKRLITTAADYASKPLEFLLLLSVHNADKTASIENLIHRVEMMKILTSEFTTYDVGVVLTNQPYFVNKAKLLRENYPSDVSIKFLMGADTLDRLFQSKYYGNDVQQMRGDVSMFYTTSGVFAYQRNGYSEDFVGDIISRKSAEEQSAISDLINRTTVISLPSEIQSVSSTKVRELLSAAHSYELCNTLVSKRVYEYCVTHKLYS